jgi:adenine phosphoribosyltransferase
MAKEIIFIIGGPGSGKGTQCKQYCSTHPGYVHLSVGDIVRSKIDNNPEFKEYIKQGKLLDDQLVLDLLKNEMNDHPSAIGFLIDGYPRTKKQIDLFETDVCSSYKVLYFDAPSHILEKRLSNRREDRTDDNPETIKKRIRTYKEQTLPAIEYLQQKNAANVTIAYIDASLTIEKMTQQVNIAMANNGVVNVGIVEFMKLYLSCGNVYDAVDTLEKRYSASDFCINVFYLTAFYIIQSRPLVKKVLAANSSLGYQYKHFDTAHGHTSIASMQTFLNSQDKNPIWNSLHKAISSSVANDKELLTELVNKHFSSILREDSFALDIAFEDFMVSLWCEYLFGSQMSADAFKKTRNDLLSALRYAFYDSRLKVVPYLGEQACRFYRYLNQDAFNAIDEQFKQYMSASNNGLISRMRDYLKNPANSSLSDTQIEALLLDNMIALILEMDFIHGAMYSTLVEIVKEKIDNPEYRKEAYHQGLRTSYLFPFRDRVANEDITLTTGTIAKGSHVFINLLKSGLYHSSGPRSCAGIGAAQWIKDAIFDQLKDIVLRKEKTELPSERATLALAKDIPVAPERYIVRWKYTRDYLQRVLPHYAFKGVDDFYDVLKLHEMPVLAHQIKERFIRKINKLEHLDKSALCIATAEVRGIPIAAMVAEALRVPLVIIRKPGKIPGDIASIQYTSAYAKDTLEISKSATVKDKQIVFIDDGLASGGSALASVALLEGLGGQVKEILTIINHEYAEDKRDVKLSQYKVGTLFDFKKPGTADSGKRELGMKY